MLRCRWGDAYKLCFDEFFHLMHWRSHGSEVTNHQLLPIGEDRGVALSIAGDI